MWLECMDYQHLTKDRSLGATELHLSDLAIASDDTTYPYQSTGVKKLIEPLRQDKGHSEKGTLHYTAEFIPCIKLKGGVKFESDAAAVNQLAVKQQGGDEDGGNVSDGESSATSDDDGVPAEVTIKPERKHHFRHKKTKSVDTMASTKTTDTSKTTETSKTDRTDGTNYTNGTAATSPSKKAAAEDTGVEMSTEELLKQRKLYSIFSWIFN